MKLTETIEEEYANVKEIEIETYKETYKNSSIHKDLLTAYEKWSKEYVFKETSLIDYEVFVVQSGIEAIKEIEYDKSDITNFLFMLEKFQDREKFFRTGYFISAMIDHHQRKREKKYKEYEKKDQKEHKKTPDTEDYLIITENFKKELLGLGAFNKKNLQIIGNGGAYLGICMQSGTIRVRGSLNHHVGHKMTGGRIEIEGDMSFIGERCNGEIYLNGRKVN